MALVLYSSKFYGAFSATLLSKFLVLLVLLFLDLALLAKAARCRRRSCRICALLTTCGLQIKAHKTTRSMDRRANRADKGSSTARTQSNEMKSEDQKKERHGQPRRSCAAGHGPALSCTHPPCRQPPNWQTCNEPAMAGRPEHWLGGLNASCAALLAFIENIS